MHFAQTHAELRTAPAQAATVAARMMWAMRMNIPAFAGLEGAMTR